jgi:hypothetical protein
MRFFLKHLFGFLSFIALVLFYFLQTNAGDRDLRYFLEEYLSKKTYNKIKVRSLNLENYPHLIMKLQINDTAKVTLEGRVSRYSIDMHYHLIGDSFSFNTFYIKDKIDVRGELFGSFSSLQIIGDGEIFDGVVNYSFLKIPKKIKDVNLQMKNVDSQKIFHFIGQKPLLKLYQIYNLKGLVDIDAKFKIFSKYKREGQIDIHMDRASIPTLAQNTSFVLNSTLYFQNVEYEYKGDISSNIGTVVITHGEYHEGKKIFNGDYKIYLKDLSYLKTILEDKYKGFLDINGSIIYDRRTQTVVIDGYTQQFGGELAYLYKNGNIELKLKALSLESLLDYFSYPALFSSKVYGKVNIDIKEKRVIINTDLRDTHFLRSKFTDTIWNRLKIDMLKGVYDQSHFSGGYENSLFSSTLIIDNGKNHLYLTDSVINFLSRKIASKFEMQMQGEEVCGAIYGTLNSPKFLLDKKRFIEYQTNKHVGHWLGTSK